VSKVHAGDVNRSCTNASTGKCCRRSYKSLTLVLVIWWISRSKFDTGVLRPVSESLIPRPPRRSATVVGESGASWINPIRDSSWYDFVEYRNSPFSEKPSKKLARVKIFNDVLQPSDITSAPPSPGERYFSPEVEKVMKYAMSTSQHVFANVKNAAAPSRSAGGG